MGGGRHSGNGWKSYDPICCSICLETVVDNGHRSWSKLKCGHQFHLDCIASEFNVKGSMQCPNCRETEEGQWLYSEGKINPECFCQWIDEPLSESEQLVIRRLRASLNDDLRQSFSDAEEMELAVRGDFLRRDIAAKLEESRARLEELRARLEDLRASMVVVTRLVWVTMICMFIVFCIKVWQKWVKSV